MESYHLNRSSQEPIYTVLGHTGLESSRIPLSPNSLAFDNREADEKFASALICEKTDRKQLSETLKNNLVLMHTTLVLFSVITLASSGVLCFSHGSESRRSFLVRFLLLGVLQVASLLALLAVTRSLRFRLRMRQLYCCVMLGASTLLVLCDQRVLGRLLQEDLARDYVNFTAVLMLFLYVYSWASFEHFLGVLLVSVYTLLVFLSVHLYAAQQFRLVPITEFLFLAVFCALLCFRTHQTEFRARHIFWRLQKEEEASNVKLEVVDRRHSAGNTFDTEREQLVTLCESIKKKIKAAAAVVIFKDIKIELKTAILEVEKVRRELATGKLNEVVKFSQNIDAQDREFIYQHFYGDSTSDQSLPRRSVLERKASLVSFPEIALEVVTSSLCGVGQNWNFDIWTLQRLTGRSVAMVGKYLFQKWDFPQILSVPEKMSDAFFMELEKGYVKNPYHNACHGADVCHSLMYFLEVSGVIKSLSNPELGAAILAALAHDLGHPGVTNRFLITNRDKVAMRYNDTSALENMHVSRLYKLLGKTELNVLSSLSTEEWTAVRKCVIQMVLHTDMSRHFESLGLFRARLSVPGDISLQRAEDRLSVLAMGLKCADVGHSAKSTELHMHWSELVCEEFFNQGALEKERGQPVSMYCDRETTDVPKSQAGFLKNICIPLYEAWVDFLSTPQVCSDCLEQQKRNLSSWEALSRVRKTSENIATVPGFQTPMSDKPQFSIQLHFPPPEDP